MCILLQKLCFFNGFYNPEVWWLWWCCLSSGGVAGCRGGILAPPCLACSLPEWNYLFQLRISLHGLLLKLQWRGFSIIWGFLLLLFGGYGCGFPELSEGFALGFALGCTGVWCAMKQHRDGLRVASAPGCLTGLVMVGSDGLCGLPGAWALLAGAAVVAQRRFLGGLQVRVSTAESCGSP